MASPDCREYGIAPDYKRCCWYCIAGAVLVGFTAVWVAKFVPGGPQRDITTMVVVLSLGVLAIFIVKGWRLRVNGDGISHRLLLGWDLWSRADLASGRIRKLKSHTLCDPNRWLWSRYLCLDFLANADRQEVLKEINKCYQLPPPPPFPEKLELRYGFRRSVTFDNSGVQLKHGRAVREMAWSDVQDIHIRRLDPVRRDFRTLLIVLPGEEIELKYAQHEGQDIPSWRGATPEEICEFFLQSPASERVFVSVITEEATRLVDAEHNLATEKKNAQAFRFCLWGYVLFSVVVFVWLLIERGILAASIMTAVHLTPNGPVTYFLYRGQQKRLTELADRVAVLKGESLPLR